MPSIDINYYVDLAKAVIIAFGGPVVIIFALSSFFGNIFSKGKIAKIEAELDKAKSQFFRYSEKQFELYNDLWRVLMRTKIMADELWENAQSSKLPAFAEQINLTRNAVMDNMLLIEELHFKDLDNLLTKFEQFQFGKQKLIEIRSSSTSSSIILASEKTIKQAISKNKSIRKEYTTIIMTIGESFRNQIKG